MTLALHNFIAKQGFALHIKDMQRKAKLYNVQRNQQGTFNVMPTFVKNHKR